MNYQELKTEINKIVEKLMSKPIDYEDALKTNTSKMNPNDYDEDGNNFVPCPICLSAHCPSKEGGKCPEEDEFVKAMDNDKYIDEVLERFVEMLPDVEDITNGQLYDKGGVEEWLKENDLE